MIVRRFLLWSRTATASDRAAGVRALAGAYVRHQMSDDDRRDAETAMLALLDDPSALVRRALADVLAGEDAPRAIVLGLVQDQPDIAARVLAFSPVLREADLIDAVAVGGDLAQIAVARRADVGVALAAAIVEVGSAEAVTAVLGSPFALLTPAVIWRAAERFGSEATVREALLTRGDLPSALRHQLAVQLAESLVGWAGGCGWMTSERGERLAREATEKVAVALAADIHASADDQLALVAHLGASGHLTPALLLRSLLCGDTALAEAALSHLSGLPLARTMDILHDRRGAGIEALCRKAGLPASLVPVIRAAIEAVRDIGSAGFPAMHAATARRITERVLIACDTVDAAENASLMALLRRFQAEVAREEAQGLADALADDAALAGLMSLDPALLALKAEPLSSLPSDSLLPDSLPPLAPPLNAAAPLALAA